MPRHAAARTLFASIGAVATLLITTSADSAELNGFDLTAALVPINEIQRGGNGSAEGPQVEDHSDFAYQLGRLAFALPRDIGPGARDRICAGLRARSLCGIHTPGAADTEVFVAAPAVAPETAPAPEPR